MVVFVEGLGLEGIVGYETRLGSCEAHLAVLCQLVAVHRGTPYAYLVNLALEGFAVGVGCDSTEFWLVETLYANDEPVGVDSTHVGGVGG